MDERQVVTTGASERYHSSEDCRAFQAGRQGSEDQGMRLHDVRWLSLRDAEALGRTPCKVCVGNRA